MASFASPSFLSASHTVISLSVRWWLVVTRGQAVNAFSESVYDDAVPDVSRIARWPRVWAKRRSIHRQIAFQRSKSNVAFVTAEETGLRSRSTPPWAIFRDGWYILSHRLLCFVATFSGLFARNNSRGGWRYRSKTARCMGEKSLIDRFLVSSHFLHYTSERRTPRREWASGLVNKFLFFFFSCYRWTFISSQQRRSARLQ